MTRPEIVQQMRAKQRNEARAGLLKVISDDLHHLHEKVDYYLMTISDNILTPFDKRVLKGLRKVLAEQRDLMDNQRGVR